MAKKYLLDSDVIIGYLAAKIPQDGMKIVSEIVDQIPNISVISQIEVLRFNDTPENEAILKNFIDASVIYPLSNNVVKRTIELCKQKKFKLPDAIIAATALTDDFTLVTRNIDDFKKIPNLELFDPFTYNESV